MKYTLFVAIIFTPFFGYSQSIKDSVQLRPLLFNHFISGTVLLKSGAVESAPLNYNTDNQNIVFIQDGQYLALEELEAIDTIYIHNKKFVPVKRAVYEIATPGISMPLFISYTNKIQPIVATVDHNGNSKQSGAQVSNTISDTYMSRTFKGNYSVRFIRHFWIKKGYTLHKANNEKQLIRLFPDKEVAIRKFIDNNQVKFDNHLDMIKLVDFCNTPEKK
jgi:hypothetical protein